MRILLVAPTVYFLLSRDYTTALWLFFIAGVSDGVDGLLARRYHWQSRLGAILDPIGDKLLLVSCYLVLGWLGHLPGLLVLVVLLRDVVIVTGAILYHLLIEEVPIQPVMISKINTVMQIALVVVVILALSKLDVAAYVSSWMLESLIWLVYATTVASGLVYIGAWGQRAVAVFRQRGHS